jgi:hypothetical protein
MLSSGRAEIQADFETLRAVVSRIVEHRFDALTSPERLVLLEHLEHETRRLDGAGACADQSARRADRRR